MDLPQPSGVPTIFGPGQAPRSVKEPEAGPRCRVNLERQVKRPKEPPAQEAHWIPRMVALETTEPNDLSSFARKIGLKG